MAIGRFYKDGGYEFMASYSGAPGYKNNSSYECIKEKGPLPRGLYRIDEPYNSPHTGAYTLSLSPSAGNDMCGRSAFKIHGDSVTHPGMASNGCIVMPLSSRKKIWDSGDRDLRVK